MAIKRDSCRATERSRMKKMALEGYSVNQISNAVSVKAHIVERVLSGEWDSTEKAKTKATQEQDRKNAFAKVDQEAERITRIAAIVAQTINGQKSEADVRAEIEKKIRAEIMAELQPAQESEKPAEVSAEEDLDAAADGMIDAA